MDNDIEVFKDVVELSATLNVAGVTAKMVHWNYQGENFSQIHLLTKSIYEFFANAEDDINEGVRSNDIAFSFLSSPQYLNLGIENLKNVRENTYASSGFNNRLLDDLSITMHIIKNKILNCLDRVTEVSPTLGDTLLSVCKELEKLKWLLDSNCKRE